MFITCNIAWEESPHFLRTWPVVQVYVPSHPLAKHWLAVARNRLAPSPVFRSALAELGRVLIYEATNEWLPTRDGEV